VKLYKTKNGIIIQKENDFHLIDEKWDSFVNDDRLYEKVITILEESEPIVDGLKIIETGLEAPIDSQELWASGVTYFRSKQGRQEESKKSGGADFYQHVYEAMKLTFHYPICCIQ